MKVKTSNKSHCSSLDILVVLRNLSGQL